MNYKVQVRLVYRSLPLLCGLFSTLLLADTNNTVNLTNPANTSNDVNILNVDNSPQGVKNPQPVQLSINQDTLLGAVGQIKSLFGFNDSNAAAVELDGGSKVFRGNATYAYAFNDKNRFKVTGEFLRENLEFDYLTGDTRQWVNQGAVGAAYQYWLGGDLFKSLQVGSHYSHAGSKDLSDQTLVLDNGTTILDQRRIAGGDDWNGTAETSMKLWPHSLVTVGGDYDRVRYDTKYEIHDDDEGDAQGFGGHIGLQQLLTSRTQLQIQSLVSQLANTYGGGLNWIWTTHGAAWGLGFNSTYTSDHTTDRRFWTNGVSLNIVWDKPKDDKDAVARFSDPDVNEENLTTWASTPAVRMPDVLAIADERITVTRNGQPVTPPFQSVTATCPANSAVSYNSATQTFSAPGGWTQSYPNAGQLAPDLGQSPAFDSANIMQNANNGPINCLYTVGMGDPDTTALILTNFNYQHVQASGSDWGDPKSLRWPSSEPDPANVCDEHHLILD